MTIVIAVLVVIAELDKEAEKSLLIAMSLYIVLVIFQEVVKAKVIEADVMVIAELVTIVAVTAAEASEAVAALAVAAGSAAVVTVVVVVFLDVLLVVLIAFVV